jgi:drug/metabolite transporter (DMT)-like permease
VAALVSTGSLVIYLPIYLALHGTCLAQLPLGEITVQAIFQGVLVSIVSLLLYGRAVAILGASGGAAFGALVPALSALLEIPLLDGWPNETDWVGILLISAGVYLAAEDRCRAGTSERAIRSWRHCAMPMRRILVEARGRWYFGANAEGNHSSGKILWSIITRG